jgi:hypothetical protein
MAATNYDNSIYDSLSTDNFVAPRVLLYNKRLYPFDPKNIVYGGKKQTPFGSSVVEMKYHLDDGNDRVAPINPVPIVLQTPVMKSPFGVSTSNLGGKTGFNLQLAFNGIANNEELRNFYIAIKLWDEQNLEATKSNREQWFKNGAKLSDEVLAYTQRKISAMSSGTDDKQYPPRINAKLNTRGGDVTTAFYDNACNVIDHTRLVRFCEVRAILKCNGMWFRDGAYSVSFKCEQAQLYSVPEVEEFNEFSFAN